MQCFALVNKTLHNSYIKTLTSRENEFKLNVKNWLYSARVQFFFYHKPLLWCLEMRKIGEAKVVAFGRSGKFGTLRCLSPPVSLSILKTDSIVRIADI